MFFAKNFERAIPRKKEIIPERIIVRSIIAKLEREIVVRSSFIAAAEPVRVFSIE